MDVNTKKQANQDFMMKAYTGLSLMRMLVESAVHFYTEKTSPFFRMAMEKDMDEELEALDLIGFALYNLHEQVCTLQAEHHKAAKAEIAEKAP